MVLTSCFNCCYKITVRFSDTPPPFPKSSLHRPPLSVSMLFPLYLTPPHSCSSAPTHKRAHTHSPGLPQSHSPPSIIGTWEPGCRHPRTLVLLSAHSNRLPRLSHTHLLNTHITQTNAQTCGCVLCV